MIELSVGNGLVFDVEETAEIVLQVSVARRPAVTLTGERLTVSLDGRPVPVAELDALDGGRLHVLTAEPGRLEIGYDARAVVGHRTAAVTGLDRIIALRPSRYCPSDRMAGFAAGQFGRLDPAWAVEAVAGFVHERTIYQAGASIGTTDAADTLLTGAGVCRDFAHWSRRSAGEPAVRRPHRPGRPRLSAAGSRARTARHVA